MANIVHILGTGTIGSPIVSLLNRHKKDFDIDEVTFHKNTPLKTDMAGIKQLIAEGAILSTDKDKFKEFEELGVKPKHDREEAIKRATIVVDATPKGFGTENKAKYYDKFKNVVKGFIAQGSESGFGKPFAYQINNEALTKDDQFIQVVSCNTHNICALVKTFYDDISEGRFVCIRRASDVSQNDDFVSGIEVDKHKDYCFGTHHARDAYRVFQTFDDPSDIPDLYSSSCIVPTQYMHAVHFSMTVNVYNLDNVIKAFKNNKMIATTDKTTSNTIFSFGRDYGHYGRILNQTVVSVPTLQVRQIYDDFHSITGFCFSPQDANSLMSSVAATLWFLNDKNWDRAEERIKVLDPYLFKEI